MLFIISKFMVKLENYTLNIITSFYYIFKFTILRFLAFVSKTIMESSYNFLNKIYEFSEQKFPPFFSRIVMFFCKLILYILKLVKLILELPSIILSLIYEIIFYIFKSFFRIYDGIVFTIVWFINLPIKIFYFFKNVFLWFINLPKTLYYKLKFIMELCLNIFFFFFNFFKSIFLLIYKIKDLKFSDLKNINKNSIRSFFNWFFKIQLGFDEHFRAQFHAFLIKHEKLVKYILTLFFFRVTQIDILTNGFLED